MKKIILLLAAVLLTMSGCEKARLDQEVDRLCRIDGGLKVYEKVKLPKENFDERGAPIWRSKDRRFYYAGDRFYTESEDQMIVTGNPDLIRIEIRLVRTSDNAVLGRSVSYTRRGGDIPNPFHPSHYTCPPTGSTGYLVTEILTKED